MGNKIPKIIDEVRLDECYDSKKVWKLDVPVTEMDIKELLWHFELPFWEKDDIPMIII